VIISKDKIRYDLSMQCALAYVINAHITDEMQIRNEMANKFHEAWDSYAYMDESQFKIHSENE